MKVGIFGGSFDPIHNGHINLARYVLDHTDIDEVWLMVSPLNPLKPQGYVATDEQRLEMARLAVKDIPGLEVSDFEFTLPIPSYTYNTLKKIKEAYPEIDFRLIIGGDNWASFEKWKNPQAIIDEFGLIVYPRPGEEISTLSNSKLIINNSSLIILKNAPLMPVSSTDIRQLLSHKRDLVNGRKEVLTLPASVLSYILSNKIYTESSQPFGL